MITKKNFARPFRKISIVSVVLLALCFFSCKSTRKTVDAEIDVIYFDNVDEYPLFNGLSAEEGFREYVAKNTIYPINAMEYGITGRVFVEFIVEKNGSVGNTKIVGGANRALETEALRVVKSSPNWTSGKKNAEQVRMRYTIPFDFRLANVNTTSSSKKVELSEETILLGEIVVTGFGIHKDYIMPR